MSHGDRSLVLSHGDNESREESRGQAPLPKGHCEQKQYNLYGGRLGGYLYYLPDPSLWLGLFRMNESSTERGSVPPRS